ncbi:hypothetical protein SH2C18_15250 [Clostridium sediminicola]
MFGKFEKDDAILGAEISTCIFDIARKYKLFRSSKAQHDRYWYSTSTWEDLVIFMKIKYGGTSVKARNPNVTK